MAAELYKFPRNRIRRIVDQQHSIADRHEDNCRAFMFGIAGGAIIVSILCGIIAYTFNFPVGSDVRLLWAIITTACLGLAAMSLLFAWICK